MKKTVLMRKSINKCSHADRFHIITEWWGIHLMSTLRTPEGHLLAELSKAQESGRCGTSHTPRSGANSMPGIDGGQNRVVVIL